MVDRCSGTWWTHSSSAFQPEDRDHLPRLARGACNLTSPAWLVARAISPPPPAGEVDARSAAGGGGGFPELQTTLPRGRSPPPQPSPARGGGSTALQCRRPRHLPAWIVARAISPPPHAGEVDARSAAGGGGAVPTSKRHPLAADRPHPSPPPHAGEGAQSCSAAMPKIAPSHLPRMRGRSTRAARRVGAGAFPSSKRRALAADRPTPALPRTRGREHSAAVLRCRRSRHLTSPACGGGRRAQRGGWGRGLSRAPNDAPSRPIAPPQPSPARGGGS